MAIRLHDEDPWRRDQTPRPDAEPHCVACGDSGVFLTPDADGESVSAQACPYCDTPYPASAGDPDEERPY